MKYEPLPMPSSTLIAPSLESPPTLELKSLPITLKYVFLGSNDTLLVIIISDLTFDQKAKLVGILKEQKEAIRQTITKLNGIDPSICMYYEVDAHHIGTCKRN